MDTKFHSRQEKQLEVTKRLIAIRKSKKISQARLSELSGVSYGSIRRFEKTGEISLASLVKLALALHLDDDLDNLFKKQDYYKSIEDVFNAY